MKQSEKKPLHKEESYKPISCSLYDKMESDATLGKTSDIKYRKRKEIVSVQSRIKTFKVKDGIEYMILEDGSEIRLDHLTQFNDSLVTFR